MPPKRGRPPKADTTNRPAVATAASTRPKRTAAAVTSDDQQPSSKRARKSASSTAEPAENATVKRGRGRPPKATKSDATPAKATAAEPVKRGRGRPPKAAPGAPTPAPAGASKAKRAVKAQAPKTVGGHQAHIANHREKAAHAPEELPLGEQVNQEEANEQLQSEALGAEPTAKRGRGRPKKEAAQPQSKPVASTGSGASRGTKRGRPKANSATKGPAAASEESEEEPQGKRAKTSKNQQVPDAATSDPGTRGRRKTIAAAGAPEPKTPAKRGRGRPIPSTDPVQRDGKATFVNEHSAAATEEAIGDANGEADDTTYVDEHGRHLWLLKAEPESRIENGKDVKFSIDDLAACTKPEPWSGVRNPVARNHMRAMKVGDLAFFYHSNAKKLSGVAGIMEIVGEATPDLTAFDKQDPYYDEKSDKSNPKWFNVHVQFRQKMPRLVTLTELKSTEGLEEMTVVKQSRLSVTKVAKKEWDIITKLAGAEDTPKEPLVPPAAPVTSPSTLAAAVKDVTETVGDKISEAPATVAAVVSAAFKTTADFLKEISEGVDVSDTLPTGKDAATKRNSRASSAQPGGQLKAPVSSSKRASSALPEQRSITSVDEDAIAGAVPPSFELKSSPPK